MIELINIHKSFNQTKVLNNINLRFEKGEITVIIGPSGSGKSTLLRLINQLERQTSGEVKYLGKNVQTPAQLKRLRQTAPMVFQSFHLFEHLSVLKNITIAQRKVLKRDKQTAQKKAFEALKAVGLSSFAHRKPSQLSGGQKQRVAIARALAMDPKVLLLDEPTSALDPETIGEVRRVLKSVLKHTPDLTAILVTHEMDFAKSIATKSIFMNNGEIVEQSKGNRLFESPTHPRTQQFLKKEQT